MAAIYDMDTGDTITDGLQGCNTCDEALDMARRIAAERGESVHLVDDDGEWSVAPDYRCERLGSAKPDDIDVERGGETEDGWNDVTVVIDGDKYDACAHVSGHGVRFGDSLDTWAGDALQERMGGDAGLIGRVQAAIKAALS